MMLLLRNILMHRQHVLTPKAYHMIPCDKSSVLHFQSPNTFLCYAFETRTIWIESTHVHLFYFFIMNRFGKHTRLGIRLGLEYTTGTCVTAGSVLLLDSIHNQARIMGTRKVTFSFPMERLGT